MSAAGRAGCICNAPAANTGNAGCSGSNGGLGRIPIVLGVCTISGGLTSTSTSSLNDDSVISRVVRALVGLLISSISNCITSRNSSINGCVATRNNSERVIFHNMGGVLITLPDVVDSINRDFLTGCSIPDS